MDNIAELIPFIIAILYFVFGRGKKKKNAPNPNRPKPAKKPSTATTSLEDILRELSGETAPKPKPKPATKPQPAYVAPPQPIESDPDYMAAEYNKISHHNSDKDIATIRKEIDEATRRENKKVEIPFDLKDAIIYDAIMNRPEY
jgi:type IV secretory pathway VirB10-like protein